MSRKATDILRGKEIEIPKDTVIEVNNTFIVNGIKYVVLSASMNNWGEWTDIEVMPIKDYIKNTTVKICKDGKVRTLKEIEEDEKQ